MRTRTTGSGRAGTWHQPHWRSRHPWEAPPFPRLQGQPITAPRAACDACRAQTCPSALSCHARPRARSRACRHVPHAERGSWPRKHTASAACLAHAVSSGARFAESIHSVACLIHRPSARGVLVRRFGWEGNRIAPGEEEACASPHLQDTLTARRRPPRSGSVSHHARLKMGIWSLSLLVLPASRLVA